MLYSAVRFYSYKCPPVYPLTEMHKEKKAYWAQTFAFFPLTEQCGDKSSHTGRTSHTCWLLVSYMSNPAHLYSIFMVFREQTERMWESDRDVMSEVCEKAKEREAQSFVKKRVAKERQKKDLRCTQKQWFPSLAASTPERHSFWCKGYSNTCLKNGRTVNIRGVTA